MLQCHTLTCLLGEVRCTQGRARRRARSETRTSCRPWERWHGYCRCRGWCCSRACGGWGRGCPWGGPAGRASHASPGGAPCSLPSPGAVYTVNTQQCQPDLLSSPQHRLILCSVRHKRTLATSQKSRASCTIVSFWYYHHDYYHWLDITLVVAEALSNAKTQTYTWLH